MKCPAEVYSPSCRPTKDPGSALPVPRPDGRGHQLRPSLPVSQEGQSQYIARRPSRGRQEMENGIWLVSFMDYGLGYVDLEEKTLQPLENPFGPKVLPMS
jgi:hypothetical protein